jgi:hypothetical protein
MLPYRLPRRKQRAILPEYLIVYHIKLNAEHVNKDHVLHERSAALENVW